MTYGEMFSWGGLAERGEDPEFGRGSNLSVRRFRGDGAHAPNPCVGPVSEPPFFGMRVRLLNTGVGYNSGYSLSRAMAFGSLAARDVARVPA